jgi:hypothetical protein
VKGFDKCGLWADANRIQEVREGWRNRIGCRECKSDADVRVWQRRRAQRGTWLMRDGASIPGAKEVIAGGGGYLVRVVAEEGGRTTHGTHCNASC